MTEAHGPVLPDACVNMQVSVYRSSRKAQTYVYLPADEDYDNLPEAFVTQFGEAELFLTFELHEGKKLAQVEARTVLAALRNQGFFLQLPPQSDHE
ncbi:MAG: YcgL domain-containing protein [bacterium]